MVHGNQMGFAIVHPLDLPDIDDADASGCSGYSALDGPEGEHLFDDGLVFGLRIDHGEYRVRVTGEAMTSEEARAAGVPFVFGLRVRHGEVYLGDLSQLPPPQRWPHRRNEYADLCVRVANGAYEGRLFVLEHEDDSLLPDWVLQLRPVDGIEHTPRWADFADVWDDDGRSGQPRTITTSERRVVHPKFGEGRVIRTEEGSSGVKLTIEFDSGARHVLLERFVRDA
ncbi:hypothetical protein [Paraliomyxa miuraensis]|uniref:hypothetical protein n=1 Tax=Paraliomyxa miuraensis TaxID=376150 RepID=UPI0022549275|nr:hypothetical protein [Paraliomyxa miuraensis]MCX4240027.1 hypothetical protein [Paraliomyxa miuraensis]